MNRRTLLSVIAAAVIGAAASSTAFAAGGFTPYSAQGFESALKSGARVLVHVHADWCPTCRQQAPTLQSMSGEPAYANAKFIRVNFDTDKDFLRAHKVSSQSTVILFKGGKEVGRFVGVTDAAQIRERVKAAL